MQLCVSYQFLFPCACIEQIAYLISRAWSRKRALTAVGIDAVTVDVNEHNADISAKADGIVCLGRGLVFLRAVGRLDKRKELFCVRFFERNARFRALLLSIAIAFLAGLSGEPSVKDG